jgi:hypothetical protein
MATSNKKKDYYYMEEEKQPIEPTQNLQPTYNVTGYTTEELPESAKNLIVENVKSVDVNKEDINLEHQKKLEEINTAINNYKKFVENYIVEEGDIKYPLELQKYAKENCQCYGRGIVGWVTITNNEDNFGDYKTFKRGENKVKLAPKFCRCLNEYIMNSIKAKSNDNQS